MASDPLRAVDLFCGAGGLSWGLVEALKTAAIEADEPTETVLEERIDLVGVNHWEIAIETHEKNHPWARHFHDDVQHVNPREVFPETDPDVKLLSGGIECTHWSSARGGQPVDEQKRMPAWDVLTWVQKLQPENVLLENVPEFKQWGPIEDDGTPSRTGETFDAWVNALHRLGYSVDWQVLNAANYGDATSRRRLFILARREHKPEFPEPTHSEDGHGDTEPWRPAADIIDWSDLGMSIWTRDEEHPRVHTPLKQKTMKRMAQGIREYGADVLEPFADALADIGREDVYALREDVVDVADAAAEAEARTDPFLVRGPVPEFVADPRPDHAGLCAPYVLGQQSQAAPRDVTAKLCPTIATRGAIGLYTPETFVLPRNGRQRGDDSNPAYDPDDQPTHVVTAKNHDGHLFSPYLVPFYGERAGQTPRTHDVEDLLPTVTATGAPPGICRPFIFDYEGPADNLADPVGTITSRERFALCVPDLYPWGLDVRFRMLQPRELAAAQGFPPEYEFAGNKGDTTEQIGNAVPVHLAQALVESLLQSSTPSLTDYLDTDRAPVDGAAKTGGATADD